MDDLAAAVYANLLCQLILRIGRTADPCDVRTPDTDRSIVDRAVFLIEADNMRSGNEKVYRNRL